MATLEYETALDIASRACQHLGVPRLTSFDDDTKEASELGFAYDKVRTAELRRNLWVFSTKKAALRALDVSSRQFFPATWSSVTTYAPGALVQQDGLYWQSKTFLNLNKTPGAFPDDWDVFFGSLYAQPWDQGTTYFAGELVYTPILWVSTTTYNTDDQVIADGIGYQSLIDDNLGLTPADNPSAWMVVSPTFTVYLSLQSNNDGFPGIDSTWLHVTGTSGAFAPLWPIGSGPASQTVTKNVYPLPYGFLREAPQDPKAGSFGYLGAPSGLQYNDWVYNSGFITTIETKVIVLRFGADVTDVHNMDPMFCEGLAARLAIECCEAITQSEGKLKAAWLSYNTVMREARMVNGIEQGPEEPPEDEYIVVRM
jgi:hypothetical protein